MDNSAGSLRFSRERLLLLFFVVVDFLLLVLLPVVSVLPVSPSSPSLVLLRAEVEVSELRGGAMPISWDVI